MNFNVTQLERGITYTAYNPLTMDNKSYLLTMNLILKISYQCF